MVIAATTLKLKEVNACHTYIPEQYVCNHKKGWGKGHVDQEPAGEVKKSW